MQKRLAKLFFEDCIIQDWFRSGYLVIPFFSELAGVDAKLELQYFDTVYTLSSLRNGFFYWCICALQAANRSCEVRINS